MQFSALWWLLTIPLLFVVVVVLGLILASRRRFSRPKKVRIFFDTYLHNIFV